MHYFWGLLKLYNSFVYKRNGGISDNKLWMKYIRTAYWIDDTSNEILAEMEVNNLWLIQLLVFSEILMASIWLHINQMDYFMILLLSFSHFWSLTAPVHHLLSLYEKEQNEHSAKLLHLCTTEERKSYAFRTTWRWVSDDRIFIWGELSQIKCKFQITWLWRWGEQKTFPLPLIVSLFTILLHCSDNPQNMWEALRQ